MSHWKFWVGKRLFLNPKSQDFHFAQSSYAFSTHPQSSTSKPLDHPSEKTRQPQGLVVRCSRPLYGWLVIPNGLTDINVTYQAERTSQLVPPQPVPPHHPPPTWRGLFDRSKRRTSGRRAAVGTTRRSCRSGRRRRTRTSGPSAPSWRSALGPLCRGGSGPARWSRRRATSPRIQAAPTNFLRDMWFQRGKKRRPNETLGFCTGKMQRTENTSRARAIAIWVISFRSRSKAVKVPLPPKLLADQMPQETKASEYMWSNHGVKKLPLLSLVSPARV